MVNLLHLVLLRRRALTLGSNAQVGTRATFVARGKYTATDARAGVRTPGRFCSRLGYDTTNGLSGDGVRTLRRVVSREVGPRHYYRPDHVVAASR